jgi:hypothetical protein
VHPDTLICIKRQWGFSYILTKKGIGRASSDVELMVIAITCEELVIF